jgi:hypothetical protein
MNTVVFDGIVRELGAVSTRRSFFRLLGGAAAVGGGLALTTHEESLGKSRGKHTGKDHAAERDHGDHGHESVSAQGRKKLITICYQNQTLTVKKKGYQTKYAGATVGACAPVPPDKTQPQPQPQPQPVTCTSFILSGGPNQSDPITIDDDGSILNVTTGTFLIIDNNGMAGPLNPVVFSGHVGDVLRVRATDWGGCRSFSPLWVHCLATGQSKQLFTGYNGSGCANPKGDFLDMTLTVAF